MNTFQWLLQTDSGEIPPKCKTIDIPGSDFWRFEAGLIVEYHIYFDQLEFLCQLGLTPTR